MIDVDGSNGTAVEKKQRQRNKTDGKESKSSGLHAGALKRRTKRIEEPTRSTDARNKKRDAVVDGQETR